MGTGDDVAVGRDDEARAAADLGFFFFIHLGHHHLLVAHGNEIKSLHFGKVFGDNDGNDGRADFAGNAHGRGYSGFGHVICCWVIIDINIWPTRCQ